MNTKEHEYSAGIEVNVLANKNDDHLILTNHTRKN